MSEGTRDAEFGASGIVGNFRPRVLRKRPVERSAALGFPMPASLMGGGVLIAGMDIGAGWGAAGLDTG